MAQRLFPLFSNVTLTRSRSPRSLAPSQLTAIAAGFPVRCAVTGSVAAGLLTARGRLNLGDALLITGSLTIVREARPFLVEAA